MSKKNKSLLILAIISIIVAFFLYIFTNFFCMGSCYLFVGDNYVGPLYSIIVGLIPTLLIFPFFPRSIFLSWVKQIAWWYTFFTLWFIANFSDSLFYSSVWLANACMIVLFILTLVYAFVMKHRNRRQVSAEQ